MRAGTGGGVSRFVHDSPMVAPITPYRP